MKYPTAFSTTRRKKIVGRKNWKLFTHDTAYSFLNSKFVEMNEKNNLFIVLNAIFPSVHRAFPTSMPLCAVAVCFVCKYAQRTLLFTYGGLLFLFRRRSALAVFTFIVCLCAFRKVKLVSKLWST